MHRGFLSGFWRAQLFRTVLARIALATDYAVAFYLLFCPWQIVLALYVFAFVAASLIRSPRSAQRKTKIGVRRINRHPCAAGQVAATWMHHAQFRSSIVIRWYHCMSASTHVIIAVS
ncbi:hypothetical protein FA95DRAFT_215412 [Auriscalpium vulgare]|uniref:Uncharacterized protein n=1 Tax=Auriscalpium vulgare TaxID=40419 RepID=A0ACB8RL53_9AGAM|nr:hypothetical protein FA95DRAFT_215412 [Auriscalpium vulgare]